MAKLESSYRRIQRFFSSNGSSAVFTPLLASKLVRSDQPQGLVLERTHRTPWKRGRPDVNLLGLGLIYQGVAIPLEYQSLQKPNQSNTEERKRLLTKALAYLDPGACCLVADREFIGRDWFGFLLDQSIDFVIRLRGNTHITLAAGRQHSWAASTHTLPRGTTRFDLHTTLFNGVPLHLVWHRPTRGEVLLLITNQTDLLHILDGYGQRWAIETKQQAQRDAPLLLACT